MKVGTKNLVTFIVGIVTYTLIYISYVTKLHMYTVVNSSCYTKMQENYYKQVNVITYYYYHRIRIILQFTSTYVSHY